MTYLSRLLVNPRHPLVRRDLADCRELHRTVLAAFPVIPSSAGARERLGVLFRLEMVNQGTQPRLLVQSQEQPDWLLLKPGYLLETGGDPENPACKSIDALAASIGVGTVLRFRLRANPTKRLSTAADGGGKRPTGKRVELNDEAAQLAWLRRKGEACGFRLPGGAGHDGVPNVRVIPEPKLTGNRHGRSEPASSKLTFGSALFDGILAVTDPPTFCDALTRGIGTGKAYGFGLLSVALIGSPR